MGHVREYLSKLDMSKYVGPDGTHPQVPIELANVIARLLSIIFDPSWQLGEMPEDWRITDVTAICRKDKEEDPRNYKLVSLTSILGKVME